MTNSLPPVPPRFEPLRPLRDRMGAPPGSPRAAPPPVRPQQPIRQDRRSTAAQSSWLASTLLYGTLALVALAAAVATFFIVAPPTELVRERIIAEVKARTGRDLVIAGPTSLSIFPLPRISMENVSLEAPAEFGGKPLVSMANLEASVELMPLLRREVAMDRLVLHQPVFELRVDGQGRKSWRFAGPGDASQPVRVAQAAAPAGTASDLPSEAQDFLMHATDQAAAPEAAGERKARRRKIALRDIKIEDGTVRYTDERTGKVREATGIDANLKLNSISGPLEAKGSAIWAGEKLDFNGKLTSPKEMLQNRPAKLTFDVASSKVTATYDGSVGAGGEVDLDGALDAKAPSLKALAKALGTHLPPVSGFEALSVSGQLKATGIKIILADAKIVLDGATSSGSVAVETAGARPYVEANLRISELDLNKYMAGARRDAADPEAEAETPAENAPDDRDPIGDLLGAPGVSDSGPKVKGFKRRAGWRTEPVDLGLIKLVDADAKISVERLIYKDVAVGQSQLTVAVKDKVLKTTFEDVQLYDGHGRGSITLDGSVDAAKVGADFAFEGVSAQPLLKDAADIDWLGGKGKFTVALAAEGQSPANLIESLNGKADLAIANGAIIGVSLPTAARRLSGGKSSRLQQSQSDKTEFSELAASFTISGGVAQNDDFRMVSPHFNVTGAGNLDLSNRRLDYTVRPKLVANPEEGVPQSLAELDIPLRVHGGWSNPSYTADLKNVLDNPDKVIDAAKEIGKKYKGKSANEIVDDLFGERKDGKPSKAKKLLDRFLKPKEENPSLNDAE